MNKKLIIGILSFLILIILSSCLLFEDNEPPIFVSDPVIENYTRGGPFFVYAGDIVNLNFEVKDNTAINTIEVFSTRHSNPLKVVVSDYNQSVYKGKNIRVNLPYSKENYSLFIRVSDINGNINQITIPTQFNSPDISRPTIGNIAINVINQDIYLYELLIPVEDIGSGISSPVNVNINGTKYNLNVFKDTPEISNYFYIEEDLVWKQKGYARVVTNLNLGENNISVEVRDNANNPLGIKSFKYRVDAVVKDSFPTLTYEAPRFVEIGNPYSILLRAVDTDANIEKLIFNNRTIQTYVPSRKSVEYTMNEIAGNLPVENSYVFEATNTTGNTSKVEFKISFVVNRPPVVNYIQVISVEDSDGNLKDMVSITEGNIIQVEENDKVTIRVKIVDELGLEKVNIYVGSRLYEFSKESFEKDLQSGYVFEKDIVWTAVRGNHSIRIDTDDTHGRRTSVEHTQQLQTLDKSKPILNRIFAEVYVEGKSDLVRILDPVQIAGENVFTIAKNDKVRFWINATAPFSGIQKIDFNIDGEIFGAQKQEKTNNYFSDNFFERNIHGEYLLNVNAINLSSEEFSLGEYTIKVLEDKTEAYEPKILLVANPLDPLIYENININADFEDDGLLDRVELEIFEIFEGERIPLTPRSNQIKYPESKSSNINFQWAAPKPSQFLVVAKAKNNLGIEKIVESNVISVENIMLDVENPVTGRTFLISGDAIPINLLTSIGADVELSYSYIEGAENPSEIPKTLIRTLRSTDGNVEISSKYNNSPVLRHSFFLNTRETIEGLGYIFDIAGSYRLYFESKYGSYSNKRYVDIEIIDTAPPVIESVILKSKDIYNTYPDLEDIEFETGYFIENQNTYFIPIDMSTVVNETDVTISLKVLDFGKITKVEAIFNGERYNLLSDPDSPPELVTTGDHRGKMRYSFIATIKKEIINVSNNDMTLIVYKEIQPDGYNYSYNVIALELEAPKISNYRMTFLDRNISINEQAKTHVFNTGAMSGISFNEILFEDNHSVSAFDMKLYKEVSDTQNDFINSVYNSRRRAANDLKIINMINVNTFGVSGLNVSSYKLPSEAGRYYLEMMLFTRSYLNAEKIPDQNIVNKLIPYTTTKSIINLNLVDNLRPAVTLEIIGTENNIIKSPGFTVEANIKDFYDQVDTNGIELWMKTPRGERKQLTINGQITKKGDLYTINTTLPGNMVDGNADLYLKFNSDITGGTFNYEDSPLPIIIDMDIRTINNLVRESSNKTIGTKLSIVVNTSDSDNLKTDVKEANFYYRRSNVSIFTKQTAVLSNQQNYYANLPIKDDGTYLSYFEMKDYAGNILTSQTLTFIVESNKPTIDNLITDTEDRNRFVMAFNSNENLINSNIIIRDDSKLNNLFIEGNGRILSIRDILQETYSINLTTLMTNLGIGTINNSNSFEMEIRATDINSNYQFFPHLEDSTEKMKIFRDNTAPHAVETDIIPSLISANRFPQDIDIFIRDNVSVKTVEIVTLKKDTTTIIQNTSMKQKTNTFGAEDWRYTLNSLPANIEGEFEMIVRAEDMAGNRSVNMILPEKIRIDNKNPEVTLSTSIPSNNLFDGIYYTNDNNRNISWVVDDFTIDASQGTVTVSNITEGNNFAQAGASKNSGNISLNTLGVAEEKEYIIRVQAIDEADLKTEKQISVIYDTTSPISTVLTGGVTNLTVTYSERLYFKINKGGTRNILNGTNLNTHGIFSINVGFIESAIFNTSNNTITFRLAGVNDTTEITFAENLTDAAGNDLLESYKFNGTNWHK